MRSGIRAGALVAAGHALLELPLVVALGWGLGEFLNRAPVVAGISLAGGIFLVWMGAMMIARPGPNPRDTPPSSGHGGALRTMAGGVLVSVSNPFWTIWWATIGLGFLAWAHREEGAIGISAFYTGHTLSDFVWYAFVGFAVASGGRFMGQRAYRLLLAACGLFLIALGAWFISVGVRELVQM
jgi:threonine/homoserine/homoserine lactone efflux protein